METTAGVYPLEAVYDKVIKWGDMVVTAVQCWAMGPEILWIAPEFYRPCSFEVDRLWHHSDMIFADCIYIKKKYG